MSNRVYESYLKTGLPKRPDGKSYSPTAYNVYRTICYRFNEKTGTAYPGEKELIRCSGVSRQSVNRAIKELKSGGLIDQPKIGHRNQRAEFRPIYHLNLIQERDKPALHIKENKESSDILESVVPVNEKRQAGHNKETSQLYPISTISNSKYDKYDKYDKYSINELRFNMLLSFIPKDFHIFIKPGKNYENKLDELERRGTTLEAVGGFLKSQSWDTSTGKGGLLSHFLDVLLGERRLGVGNSKTSWCGECDEDTRSWDMPSEINGKEDYRCTACNDQLLNEMKRLRSRKDEALDFSSLFRGASDI